MHARQIAYFLAVVEHGGLGRAASALQVSQPTLSQAVRALERDLGADLFHRTAPGLVLSAAGRALLGPARQLLRDVASARESVGLRPDSRSLDLVAATSLGVYPAAGLVAGFRAHHPGVAVRLDRTDPGVALSTMVSDGSSELGLNYLSAPHPELVEIELGVQELLLALPPGRSGGPGPVALTELDGVNLIANPPGTPLRDLVEAVLRTERVVPRVVMELRHRGAILDLVGAGVAAAFLVDQAAPAALARGVPMYRTTPPLRLSYGLVRRPVPPSASAQAFIEHALARAVPR